MDGITQFLCENFMTKYQVKAECLAKVAAIMVAAAEALAARMAKEAVDSLTTLGGSPSGLSLRDFLGYAARIQFEKLNAIGMLRCSKLTLNNTACAKKGCKSFSPRISAAETANIAFFMDVTGYMTKHFLPTRCLLAMLLEPGAIEALSPNEYATPGPYSAEARNCMASLNTIPFAAVKTRSIIVQPFGIENILRKPALTLEEAACILGVSHKTLGDMCRDGRFPESGYSRYAKTGTYHFITERVLGFLNKNKENLKKR